MWEQIRANRRRSTVLILLMAGVLPALGCAIAYVIAPEAWGIGLAVGAILAAIAVPAAVFGGGTILLMSADAREIRHDDSPVLFNVVQEMTIAAGLPKPPRVYIMDCDSPNAFAVGTPEDSAVAVTTGLLIRLNRDELQGVIAHEIGHIRNEDTRFMTIAGVLMGMVVIISDVFRRGFCRSSGRRRSSAGGGQAQAIILIVALIFIVVAPILIRLLYFACSRRREYLADACSAWFTRYPAGLASALEKIERSTDGMKGVNGALAPMFIINPLAAEGGADLFSTHPPTAERVKVLRSMAGGAGLNCYQAAYARARGERLLDGSSVPLAGDIPIRAPSAEPEKPLLARTRDAVDIIHRLQGAIFVPCGCGASIKVPSGYDAPSVHCPLCGRENRIPAPAPAPAPAVAQVPVGPPLFRYTPGRWQSLRCACGTTIQLSPSFRAQRIQCPKCGARIETVPA